MLLADHAFARAPSKRAGAHGQDSQQARDSGYMGSIVYLPDHTYG